MTSPDEDPNSKSELDYAPPWIREQAAREQTAREQTTRDQTPREQFRAALRHSGGAAIEQRAQNSDAESRGLGDDRPWHQRALEPELVPEPPPGASNLWPIMLRMGAVCTIAAMVAAAVVFLSSPKQAVHKVAQADALAPASAPDNTPSSIESAPAVPAGVPALAVEGAAGVTTAPPAAPSQVAVATAPPIAQSQVAVATPPQLPEAKVVTAPPPATSGPQIASLPTPNSAPANANPPATDPKPAASPASLPAPAQTAPTQAAPQDGPRPAVVLDENEINTLTRRGKNLLNDGDFAAARVLFERAANAGSAEAALALGSTYDPNVIKRLGAIMVKPDIERARKWYQLAADRGSAAASLQLANLPQAH
jgi:hypothetical protein